MLSTAPRTQAARPLLLRLRERSPRILRIQAELNDGRRRCRLAGRLDAESAEEARRTLAAQVDLCAADLADLVAVDEAGLTLLADLRAAGVALVDLSPYLALRLERHAARSHLRIEAGAGRDDAKRP